MIKTITPFASPDLLLPFPIGSITQEADIHGLKSMVSFPSGFLLDEAKWKFLQEMD